MIVADDRNRRSVGHGFLETQNARRLDAGKMERLEGGLDLADGRGASTVWRIAVQTAFGASLKGYNTFSIL